MNVTGQSVLTPRSNTITGTPVSHAASTAGVSVSVVFGDTISASQLRPARLSMSEICLSSLASASTERKLPISGWSLTSSCIVFQPTWRHGVSTAALEKQMFQSPLLSALRSDVSTISGSIACSHGLSAGPSGSTSRCSSWRSKSSWTKNSDCSPVFDSVSSSGAGVAPPPGSSDSSVPHAPITSAHASRANSPASLLHVIDSLLSVSPRAPQPVGGEGDGGDDDHALHRVLERTRDALQVEPGEQRLERQRAGHRADDRPAAAAEHDPAEDDRRDRLELEPLADLRGDAGEPAEQDAGERRAHPREHERDRPHVVHAYAREPGRAVVVA